MSAPSDPPPSARDPADLLLRAARIRAVAVKQEAHNGRLLAKLLRAATALTAGRRRLASITRRLSKANAEWQKAHDLAHDQRRAARNPPKAAPAPESGGAGPCST